MMDPEFLFGTDLRKSVQALFENNLFLFYLMEELGLFADLEPVKLEKMIERSRARAQFLCEQKIAEKREKKLAEMTDQERGVADFMKKILGGDNLLDRLDK